MGPKGRRKRALVRSKRKISFCASKECYYLCMCHVASTGHLDTAVKTKESKVLALKVYRLAVEEENKLQMIIDTDQC